LPKDQKVPHLPISPNRRRSNRKLLAFLFVFFITVLVILFFQSSLSRISDVQIEGNVLITKDAVGQASAIHVGDRFFATSAKTIEDRVKGLKMVKSSSVTKHFPGVVHILVQEYPQIAFQITTEGKKQAVLADGSVIDLSTGDFSLDRPILTGWADNDPNKTNLCKVLGDLSVTALSDISEIIPDPSVAYPDKIKIYTRSQYEVYTTIAYLPDKIETLPALIADLKENNKTNGIINMLEVDSHAPFETSENAPDKEGNKSSGKASPTTGITPKSTPKATPKTTPKETVKPS
jgi:cell division protein FtsQ